MHADYDQFTPDEARRFHFLGEDINTRSPLGERLKTECEAGIYSDSHHYKECQAKRMQELVDAWSSTSETAWDDFIRRYIGTAKFLSGQKASYILDELRDDLEFWIRVLGKAYFSQGCKYHDELMGTRRHQHKKLVVEGGTPQQIAA